MFSVPLAAAIVVFHWIKRDQREILSNSINSLLDSLLWVSCLFTVFTCCGFVFVLWPQQVCQIVPELFFFLLSRGGRWNVRQLCLTCPDSVFSSPSYECCVGCVDCVSAAHSVSLPAWSLPDWAPTTSPGRTGALCTQAIPPSLTTHSDNPSQWITPAQHKLCNPCRH